MTAPHKTINLWNVSRKWHLLHGAASYSAIARLEGTVARLKTRLEGEQINNSGTNLSKPKYSRLRQQC
jgi:hypothetical protein